MADASVTPPGRWLPVPGYEGYYEVSDQGHVRSLPRSTRAGMRGGRVLQRHLRRRKGHSPYWLVSLSREGVIWTGPVYRLVMPAFHGPCPEGLERLHGPGGSLDDRAVNLSYGTHAQNMQDRTRDGTQPSGEQSHLAKLTQESVAAIRRAAADGETQRALGRRYGVTQANISMIVTGKTWKKRTN